MKRISDLVVSGQKSEVAPTKRLKKKVACVRIMKKKKVLDEEQEQKQKMQKSSNYEKLDRQIPSQPKVLKLRGLREGR